MMAAGRADVSEVVAGEERVRQGPQLDVGQKLGALGTILPIITYHPLKGFLGLTGGYR